MATPLNIADLLESSRANASALHARYGNQAFVELMEATGVGVECVRGEGQYLWTRQGRRLVDCMAGYGAIAIGRSHPVVVDALKQCLDLAPPAWVRWELAPLVGEASRALASACGGPARRVFFTNSGTEATEAAIKFARRATGRAGILGWEGAFHGMSCGALSLNGSPQLTDGFGPLLADASLIGFGDLDALDSVLSRQATAAFFIEPVQGKSLRFLAPGLLKEVKRICHSHGTLLVADEIQTGGGRTGAFLASHLDGVEPDMVLLSKAISGGMIPVGAVLATDAIMRAVHPSLDRAVIHSSTLHEGPLAMVAVLTTLRVIDEDRLAARSAALGTRLRLECESACAGLPSFGGFIGRGLMAGVELDAQRVPSLGALPWAGALTRPLVGQALVHSMVHRHGVLAQVTGARSSVLKLLPPMVVNEDDIRQIAAAVASGLRDLEGGAFADALGRAIVIQPGQALKRVGASIARALTPNDPSGT